MVDDWFRDRPGVLATMHRKEQVIAPLMQRHLGLELVIPPKFNSDQYGTFTRDVQRPGDQLQTARLKAEAAMAATGMAIALASEGAFGPHPLLPFTAANRELVILLDRDRQLELVGEHWSPETNFSHRQVQRIEEALEFAQKAGFPEHGLVVMADPSLGRSSDVTKGVTTEAQLIATVTSLLQREGCAHIETDMRAMHNPTRMKAIEQATLDLIQQFHRRCPQCDWPGFRIQERRRGLPCAWCHSPTELTLSVLYRCTQCGFTKDDPYPDGSQYADPAHCSYCNP